MPFDMLSCVLLWPETLWHALGTCFGISGMPVCLSAGRACVLLQAGPPAFRQHANACSSPRVAQAFAPNQECEIRPAASCLQL